MPGLYVEMRRNSVHSIFPVVIVLITGLLFMHVLAVDIRRHASIGEMHVMVHTQACVSLNQTEREQAPGRAWS
jgi:hypothetical protein